MTTVDGPLNEDSGKNGASRESTTAALRRRREESATEHQAVEVRQELQELARTLGAASLSLVELQKETSTLADRTESTRRETLERMDGLVESARRLFGNMELEIKTNNYAVQTALAQVREESTKRAAQEQWQFKAFVAGGLTACLIAGWAGWRVRDKNAAEEMADELANRRRTELFAVYMLEVHPKETDKYWKTFQSWAEKNAVKN